MKKVIAFSTAIALLGLCSHLPAQTRYSPYDNDIYINLNQPGTHPGAHYPPPAPTPYSTDPLNPMGTSYPSDISYAPGSCGVAAAMSAGGGSYYDPNSRPNTKGYQGVSCASRAGEVASISVCEMLAATAVVGAIIVIALIFHGGSVHSHAHH